MNISNELRSNIIILNEEGYSQRAIANRLRVSKTAVQETIARKRSTGSFVPLKRPGRPRKTSKQTDNLIHRIVVAQPTSSSSFIQTQLPPHVNISTKTIRRRLCDDFKLRSYRPAVKPKLSAKNIKDRLKFCQDHRHWGVVEWSRVMFSDESLIRQFNPPALHVRRPINNRWNSRYVQPTVKQSPSIMIWGSITAQGAAGFYLVENGETINAARYLAIVNDQIPQWFATRNCDIFMHDGAPCHQAKVCRTWFQNQQITVLGPWPGSSPDLNPIENCWRLLKKKVSRLFPTSIEDLRMKIAKVWTLEITQDYCQKLVHSMPQRIESVIAAHGRHTKY